MQKIDEKASFTEVYHLVMKTANLYSGISAKVPRALIEVSQHIHGRFDDAAFHIYAASNTFDTKEKRMHLIAAKDDLFFQYNSIEYLVKTKAISVGAANTVITPLRDAYDQVSKWYNATNNSLIKQGKLES